MDDATDFLIRYDLATSREERADLLSAEFSHPTDRDAFHLLVHDPIARAMFEMEYNSAIRFEDYAPLRDAGLIFVVGEFIPRVPFGDGILEPIRDIAKTFLGRDWRPDVPDDRCPDRFFAPYVTRYLWRATACEIVASRTSFEGAMSIPDVDDSPV